MAYDGLTDAYDRSSMGESTDRYNAGYGIGRAEQDEFAARSYQRAAAAIKNGLFEAEIAPVSVPQRRGEPIEVREDEGVRADTTAESLGKLRPAFSADGTITAGSSSPISDGAAAVVVMRKSKAIELGLSWIAEIGGARLRRRTRQLAALAAGQRDQGRPGQGRARRRRPRPRSRSTRRSPRSGSSR